ncbi:hypothetical protein ACFL5X_02130 [Candidatus Omnitrophota bacterium]
MKRYNNKSGFGLLLVFLVSSVLLVLSAPLLQRAVSENLLSERFTKSTQAFWHAEAGVNKALYELKKNYSTSPGSSIWADSLDKGSYSIDITPVSGFDRMIIAHGYAPVLNGGQVERTIKVTVRNAGSTDIFSDAIYSAKDVTLNGNAYSVTGNVTYAADINGDTSNIDGTITHDPSISPLAMLDFETLRNIAQAQGNYYDAARLSEHFWEDDLPSQFWAAESIDGVDNDEDGQVDEPYEEYNVVYIENDLTLNGVFPPLGGLIVVAGDIISDPDDTDDMVINGVGEINGVIYTRGVFRVNGGAGSINVNGGVICGELGKLNGNVNVTFNAEYMMALSDSVTVEGNVMVVSWEEQ